MMFSTFFYISVIINIHFWPRFSLDFSLPTFFSSIFSVNVILINLLCHCNSHQPSLPMLFSSTFTVNVILINLLCQCYCEHSSQLMLIWTFFSVCDIPTCFSANDFLNIHQNVVLHPLLFLHNFLTNCAPLATYMGNRPHDLSVIENNVFVAIITFFVTLPSIASESVEISFSTSEK